MLGPGLRTTVQTLRDDVHFFVSETGYSYRQIALEAGIDQKALRAIDRGEGITTTVHDKIRAAMVRLSVAFQMRQATAAPNGAGANGGAAPSAAPASAGQTQP